MQSLRITEIFHSLQGESTFVGLPTVFVRLTGCPLRCTYCDTAYAFKGGTRLRVDEILKQVEQYQTQYVTVTGGEPLAQPDVHVLLQRLCDKGLTVSLETSGALDISEVDKRVVVVMDLKTPSSAEASKNRYANIDHLKKTDQIKFVIGSREDYLWSKDVIAKYTLDSKVDILMSPTWDKLALASLAGWILEDGLNVRYQIQLHKVIWPHEESGV